MFGPAEVIPTLILLGGLVDDIKSRKVHNQLVLTFAAVALVSSYWLGGWPGVQVGLIGFAVALLATLPLVLVGILGAGDMKLLAAFGLATNWSAVLTVLLTSILWGAILGVLRAALGGQFRELLLSTAQLAMRRKGNTAQLHKIPYTVALFFGWLTYLTLARIPGGTLW